MSPTESEKRLYAAMLHAMAMDLYTPYAIIILPGGEDETGLRLTEQGRKGFVREDFYNGYYKTAYARLADFGLVEPVKRDGSPASISDYTGHWALAVDLDDVVAHVLSHFPDRVPTLDEVLTGFIGMARVPTSRAPFVPKPEYLPVLQHLAEHGYLGRTGDKFRWTDNAAPAMRGAYHWDDNDQSSADQHEARLDEIWSSMPLDLKKEIFFNGEVDVFLFAAVYSRWLDEGKWLRVDIKEELNDGHGGGFAVAQELEERFVLPMRGGR
jgi:hypothetical protein